MHIFVEIRYMDHGVNIEKNETIKFLRPGSYSRSPKLLTGNDEYHSIGFDELNSKKLFLLQEHF